MSTLKVNKLRDTSGSADAITLDPNGGAVLAGVTTVSTVKVGSGVTISSDGDVFTTGITTSSTVIVGSGVTISESGIEASGIGITVANINGGQISGRRNIIINGAMNIAQRIGGQTSTTTTSGFSGVDRWSNSYSHDATMTFAQHQLTYSSDSGPVEEGFRYSYHVTNGDTTANAGQYCVPQQPIEAQNISVSGWNYKSSTSYITLSFWVKSSVGQEYHGSLMTTDGTIYKYPFSFTVSADTWTKVVKTIPGNSSLQIDNNNGEGVRLNIAPYMGTNYTASGVTNDTWSTWSSSARFKDFTSTWWTTNGATFEFTGVQLEAGSQATAYEHLSFGEEMTLCQRYYYQNTSYGTVVANDSGETINTAGYGGITMYSATSGRSPFIPHPVKMRTTPTTTFYSASNASGGRSNVLSIYSGSTGWDDVASQTVNATDYAVGFKITTADNFTAGYTYLMGGQFTCSAEL